MRELAQDPAAALAVLYDRYANLVYSFAMRMVGDPEVARDLVRQAFTLVWERRSTFDPRRLTFAAWLLAQAHALGVEAAQHRRANPQRATGLLPGENGDDDAASVLPDLGATSERESVIARRRRQVRDALQTLSKEQRRTLELAYFQGYTQDEIARLSGESSNMVRSHLRLSLLRLREVLQPAGTGGGP
ncbi:MAG TPA: sigma-70 family RNA polymerase sigma factor [Chloroflexota bacterium]|jgi:RNA polymerase sigma-70 factor (ECF subfamily)|nr:sigma-70 family RNA polymerase sigma factor [Chloroflexota bacterium]